ncbi:zona pellucida sperm-binding protein 3-like [Parambassis ranga]|uniref:Zona pellucida sperm-binding protein 3 n=1 Tax=Parambassis ranga TaxID=210632 RepID=A0A6P7K1Y8_9TELE|nr:zona pellucida sperm-binding protein 3-like [Parambassis ranga]
MEIVVQADMFDTGIRVDGRSLRLGSNSEGIECRSVPSGGTEFTIQAQLMDCGTKLSSTKEKIVYSNVLVYSPEPSSEGLLRLEGATIPVECHFEKRYSVNAFSLHPTWFPLVTTVSSDDQIDFSLLLMTDDWQFERGSSTYYIGDPVHFEISAIVRNHTSLRVYVDRCVATATPDAETTLKYDFIEHHGCLVDAYLTNSTSHFLPRVEEHKLRFRLDAFRFYQGPTNQVYVTCYVKAVPVTLTISSHNRACSFIENRWQSVDGNNQACRSCDVSQRVEEPVSTEPPTTTTSTTAWLTRTTHSSLDENKPKHHSATYVRFHPRMFQGQNPEQSPAKIMRTGDNYNAEQTVQLGPLIVRPSNKFVTRPADSKTVLPGNDKPS